MRGTTMGALVLALVLGGCGDGRGGADAGLTPSDAGEGTDAGGADAGAPPDGGLEADGGSLDAGAPADAGGGRDAGPPATECDPTTPPPPAGAVLERISDDDASGVAITVGCDGVPLIAYTDRGVHLAERTGDDAWDTELVADDAFARHIDADVTPAGIVHVTIARWNTDGVVYHRREGGTWTEEDVDPFTRARWLRQTLDHEGRPHVAYITEADDAAIYAARGEAGWASAAAYSDDLADFAQVAFEVDGTARMLLQRYRDPDTIVDMRREAGAWVVRPLDDTTRHAATSAVGGYASFAIGADDVAHYVYSAHDGMFSPDFQELRYASRDGDSLTYESALPDARPTGRTDLQLGPDGVPHVTVITVNASGTTDSIRYGSRAGGAWSFRTLDADVDRLAGSSLAVDRWGTAHVVWSDAIAVRYARIPAGP